MFDGMFMGLVVALAGGVGAAKLLRGLVHVVPPEDLVIIGNVGDDFDFHGLHVSPDLDIVMYTLAGIVEPTRGWGVEDDTLNCLSMLQRLGFETWFKLGDKDVAVQMVRTDLLRSGASLSDAVRELCRLLGVKTRLIPMTNDHVRTMVVSGYTRLGFQEYFVKRRAADEVTGVLFEGCDVARPAPDVIESIDRAERVVVCPSNPILSINPILAIPGIRDALKKTKGLVVGVSPIVGGKAIKGPADRIMSSLGIEASAHGVAKLYEDFLDHIIIDRADADLETRIKELGIRASVTDTIMKNVENAVSLAVKVMDAK